MKKTIIQTAIFTAMLIIISSACKKDELSQREQEAIRLTNSVPDSLNKAVEYTVNLVDAAINSFLKSGSNTNSMSGAVVTAAQNSQVFSKTTDDKGMVVFNQMKQGTIAVKVQLTGYSEVNYTITVNPGYASSLVPMIPVSGTSNASIEGKLTFESDLTNTTTEAASGATVLATVKTNMGTFASSGYTMFDQFSYDGLSLSATTNTSGEFEITVPATADGLVYEVHVQDFQVDQNLLMSTLNGVEVAGVQTVKAIFGTNGIAPSPVEDISPAYVSIGAPNYSITQQAQAIAIIDNDNGIDAIVLSNNGSSYETPGSGSYYNIAIDNLSGTSTASLQAYVYNGRVTHVVVMSSGEDFSAGSYTINYEQEPFDGDVSWIGGDVAYITINDGGQFMNITDIIVKVEGTNMTSDANVDFSWNAGGRYYYVSNIEIDNAAARMQKEQPLYRMKEY
ncbi:MAG: hypothetical protein HY738_06395 [Bacteroidia bacterium]|nr:hypothetical protein [Bacteroidia bacterium]